MMKAPICFAGAVLAATLALAPLAVSADTIVASGTFKGASDHVTTGGVSIVRTAKGGAVVILDTNFSLDGAPDPRVGLGKNGKYDKASDLGELENIKGLQAYTVPANLDVSKYNEVYVWCRKFSVPLGVASMN